MNAIEVVKNEPYISKDKQCINMLKGEYVMSYVTQWRITNGSQFCLVKRSIKLLFNWSLIENNKFQK